VLAGVEHLTFLYDQIKMVEYADFVGIGYRVAQAKKANLLPPEVNTVCFCHGNTFYLDSAEGAVNTTRDLAIDVKERIGVELADYVVFPSLFLEDLYINKLGLLIKRRVLVPLSEVVHSKRAD
jgi:hypothetical protein